MLSIDEGSHGILWFIAYIFQCALKFVVSFVGFFPLLYTFQRIVWPDAKTIFDHDEPDIAPDEPTPSITPLIDHESDVALDEWAVGSDISVAPPFEPDANKPAVQQPEKVVHPAVAAGFFLVYMSRAVQYTLPTSTRSSWLDILIDEFVIWTVALTIAALMVVGRPAWRCFKKTGHRRKATQGGDEARDWNVEAAT